jgi:hypothetical protein
VTSLSEPQCRVTCADNSECREGYTCGDFDGVNSYCVGPPRQSPNIPFDLSTYPIPLTCEPTTDSKLDLRYTIPTGDTRHSVVVFSPLGYPISLATLTTPVASIDLPTSYGFALEIANIYHRWLAALTLPALGALSDKHSSGEQTLRVLSASPTLCWYVLSHKGQGGYLDVNIYIAGKPDVTQLSDMPGLVSVVARVNQFAALMSFTVRPRILALPPQAHEALRFVRNENDLAELSRLTQASIEGAAQPLSLNLILVEGFADARLLGISLGLPGAPGLHGLPVSAVFATYPADGVGNQTALAKTITHEIGHYLGLRHTSELYPGAYDPHPDTPPCADAYYAPQMCPDLNNLMFPSINFYNTVVSPDQVYLVRSNPLIVP